MTYSFGARSKGFMVGVHPSLVSIASEALERSPVDFGCSEPQTRTPAQQAEKVRLGYSKSLNGPHVIKPDGFGHALDLVPWIDGLFQWGDDQWRVHTRDGRTLKPFYDIASVMREVSLEHKVPIRWGAVWDRPLGALPATAAGLEQAVADYKVRHAGSDFLDGPHYELI